MPARKLVVRTVLLRLRWRLRTRAALPRRGAKAAVAKTCVPKAILPLPLLLSERTVLARGLSEWGRLPGLAWLALAELWRLPGDAGQLLHIEDKLPFVVLLVLVELLDAPARHFARHARDAAPNRLAAAKRRITLTERTVRLRRLTSQLILYRLQAGVHARRRRSPIPVARIPRVISPLGKARIRILAILKLIVREAIVRGEAAVLREAVILLKPARRRKPVILLKTVALGKAVLVRAVREIGAPSRKPPWKPLLKRHRPGLASETGGLKSRLAAKLLIRISRLAKPRLRLVGKPRLTIQTLLIRRPRLPGRAIIVALIVIRLIRVRLVIRQTIIVRLTIARLNIISLVGIAVVGLSAGLLRIAPRICIGLGRRLFLVSAILIVGLVPISWRGRNPLAGHMVAGPAGQSDIHTARVGVRLPLQLRLGLSLLLSR